MPVSSARFLVLPTPYTHPPPLIIFRNLFIKREMPHLIRLSLFPYLSPTNFAVSFQM